MELDLWEGQFNLSSLQGLVGLEEGQYEDFSRGTTCWAEDSVVTMGTVRLTGFLLFKCRYCRSTS